MAEIPWLSRRRRAYAHRRWRGRRGERMLHYTPAVLIEYPAEVFVAFWALMSGPAVLSGHSGSEVFALMPGWAQMLWGILMCGGGTSIVLGLRLRHYGTSVARGMQVVGTASFVHAALTAEYAGVLFRWPTFALLVGLGLLLYWRGAWLRARDALHARIFQEAGER